MYPSIYEGVNELYKTCGKGVQSAVSKGFLAWHKSVRAFLVKEARMRTPELTGALVESERVEFILDETMYFLLLIAGNDSIDYALFIHEAQVTDEGFSETQTEQLSATRGGSYSLGKKSKAKGSLVGNKYVERAIKDNIKTLKRRLVIHLRKALKREFDKPVRIKVGVTLYGS